MPDEDYIYSLSSALRDQTCATQIVRSAYCQSTKSIEQSKIRRLCHKSYYFFHTLVFTLFHGGGVWKRGCEKKGVKGSGCE